MAKVDIQVVAQMNQLKKSVSEMNKSIGTLTGMVAKNAKAFNVAQQQIRSMNNSITNLNKDANRSDAIFGKLGGTLKMMVGAGALLGLGRQLGFFVKSATAMIETNNLFAVSMGKVTESANQFVLAMTEAVGLDATNMRNAIGTFGLLSRSMGVNNENAKTLSTTMYQLGLDLSSLTNVDINQVMSDLRSGLLGQSETVYKYGIDVTEASLKTEALAQGITKSVRNMGQGEKMALRYAVMLKQTTLAQGDFARTLETPANQMRVLKERFITLSRTIGTIFIPVLGATLPYANAIVKVLNELFMALARLVGYKDAPIEGIETGTGGTATNLEDAVGSAKQLKQVMSGIDELNVISEQSSGGAGTGVDLGDPNAFQFNTYDALLAGIRTKSDEVADSIRRVFSAIGEKLEPLLEPLAKLGNLGQSGFTWLWENVLIPFGSWTWNELLPKAINLIVKSIELLNEVISNPVFIGAIKWLYDNVLIPTYGLMGTVITSAIDLISDNLKAITEYLSSDSFVSSVNWLYDNVLTPIIDIASNSIVLLIDYLIQMFDSFGLGVDSFKTTSWVPFGETVMEIIQLIIDNFNELSSVFNLVYKLTISPLLKSIGELFKGLFDNYLKPFFVEVFKLFRELGTLVGIIFKQVNNSFFKPLVDTFLVYVLPNLTNVFSTIAGLFNSLLRLAISIATELIKAFRGVVVFMTGVFTGDFKKAMNGLGLISEAILNSMIALFEGAINGLIQLVIGGVNAMLNGVNSALAGINRMFDGIPKEILDFLGLASAPNFGFVGQITAPQLSLGRFKFASEAFEKSLGGGVNVRQFANGGFPDQGELFIAREAGAEMVGSIGGRSAVVNNEQIVEAVAQGVARAVAGVMQGGGQVIENVINIDGEVLYKNQQEVSRKRGIDFGMGVFAR